MGDQVYLLDGRGSERAREITALSNGCVTARIDSPETVPGGTAAFSHACGLSSKTRQAGADRSKGNGTGNIEHNSGKLPEDGCRPDPEKIAERLARWRRIAEEAAEQSGRGLAPGVVGLVILPIWRKRFQPTTSAFWRGAPRIGRSSGLFGRGTCPAAVNSARSFSRAYLQQEVLHRLRRRGRWPPSPSPAPAR